MPCDETLDQEDQQEDTKDEGQELACLGWYRSVAINIEFQLLRINVIEEYRANQSLFLGIPFPRFCVGFLLVRIRFLFVAHLKKLIY